MEDSKLRSFFNRMQGTDILILLLKMFIIKNTNMEYILYDTEIEG
jgi:hypothetical protein